MSMAPGGQFGECVGDEAVINVEVVEWLLKAFMVPLSEKNMDSIYKYLSDWLISQIQFKYEKVK